MTMGYTLVYGLINFAILATTLFFIGRKLVPKIFGGRRDQIVEDLKNADSAVENRMYCSRGSRTRTARARKNAPAS